jgi:glycosyltransferase involved in cell wall biosynthesis
MDKREQLRILQLCSSTAVSGAEKNVFGLSTALRQRGHYVQTVIPGQGWLSAALLTEEIPCHSMSMRNIGWWKTVAYCLRQMKQNRVDVIHTHLTRAAYIGHMVGLISRKPVVTSVHIDNHDNIYRKLAHGSNRIVAVSDYVRGVLHGLGVPGSYIETVYNGTDFLDLPETDPNLTRASINMANEKEIIGVVARVCREKGSLEMVRAMKAIASANPNAQLLFVGRVVEDFRAELEAEIDLQGLRNKVTFAGIRHDIPAIIDTFSVAVMPSVLETFGISALESMARGNPVVATRVGGLPELIKDGQTGLLVDLQESEIAEAINRLLANKDLRETMGQNGRKAVAEKFTLDHMVDRFESVYEKCLNHR